VVDTLPIVLGNHRQLQQLLQNLLGNALKYSRQGIDPLVTISAVEVSANDPLLSGLPDKRSTGYHLIQIEDNGIGFASEDSERIFNVFTRLHGNSEYKGSGVGLSIVRKVVENHSGHIWAEAVPGGGATFKMLFPVV
jgi:signal transduction histidine kinase